MNAGRLYPGQILASAQKLIVVTFNYRLGPLGKHLLLSYLRLGI